MRNPVQRFDIDESTIVLDLSLVASVVTTSGGTLDIRFNNGRVEGLRFDMLDFSDPDVSAQVVALESAWIAWRGRQ